MIRLIPPTARPRHAAARSPASPPAPYQAPRHARWHACRLILPALLAALGCADFDPPQPPQVPDRLVATPSFSADIQPIFTGRCATVSCHTVATHQADLVLERGYAYAEIVGVRATLDARQWIVKPFEPDSSWLVHLIRDDEARRLNVARMPLGRAPLTDNQIANIVAWVAQGAKND